jgi:hypothetical protein
MICVMRRVAASVGVAGMVLALWFYLASGLVAPPWAVGVLLAIWVLMLVLCIRWFRRRPFVVLAMPLVAAAVWLAVISAGGAWLGWTA